MKPFERWSVWVTSFLTVATGTGYFVTKYLLSSPDPYAIVNHPLQPIFLKLHVVTSPLLLFALGLIAVRHVWRHFRSGVRWSRKSGMVTALSIVPMVLTGYLIQVLTSAGWIRAMAISHVVFGFLFAVGFGAHSWVIRRREPPEPRFCDDVEERNFSASGAKDSVREHRTPTRGDRERARDEVTAGAGGDPRREVAR